MHQQLGIMLEHKEIFKRVIIQLKLIFSSQMRNYLITTQNTSGIQNTRCMKIECLIL
jgi:hypothetical protein